jgi:hypothetical protein
MKTIPLTQGKAAIIDDCDSDLALFKWHFHRTGKDGKGYAARNAPGKGFTGWIYLHKIIAERVGLHGEIDHHDRNPLNNRRRNLRESTHKENSRNGPRRRNNTSNYTGVSWREDRQVYRVHCCQRKTKGTRTLQKQAGGRAALQ